MINELFYAQITNSKGSATGIRDIHIHSSSIKIVKILDKTMVAGSTKYVMQDIDIGEIHHLFPERLTKSLSSDEIDEARNSKKYKYL